MENQNTVSERSSSETSQSQDNRKFITPGGAGIAIICFFLPWVKVSCMGQEKTASGAQIGNVFWIVFACALLVLAAYFFFSSQRKADNSKPVVFIASIIGIGIMIWKYLELENGLKTPFGTTIKPKDIGLELQFGAFGTLAGFILAMIGTAFLKSEAPSPIHVSEKYGGGFCGSCGAQLSVVDLFCPGCGAKTELEAPQLGPLTSIFCPHCYKTVTAHEGQPSCPECGRSWPS